MIAQLGSDVDIVVYLAKEEVVRISKEIIEGVLVRINDPKRQGILKIIVDDKKAREKDYGIGVELNLKETSAEIFVSDSFYRDFLERGRTGTRYGHIGSKISLLDLSRCNSMDKIHAEQLEFYRDNRGRLRL